MKLISAGLVDTYLEYGALLIDLRPAAEYRKGHIRGAVSIPVLQIERAIAWLPKNRILVLYCERGGTSAAVGRRLTHAGFRTLSVAGGIKAYQGELVR